MTPDPDSRALFDIGAQAERTSLAWQRTALGVVAVGALSIRWSVTENFPVFPGIALVVFGAIAGLFVVRQRYLRVLKTVTTGQNPLSRYIIGLTTVFMIVVIGAIAIGVAIEFSRE